MKRPALWFPALTLLLILLGGCVPPPPAAPGMTQTDDVNLSVRVREALSALEQLDASRIRVENHGGVVELSGTVDTDAQRETAVQTARRVEGVKSVKDGLTIQ